MRDVLEIFEISLRHVFSFGFVILSRKKTSFEPEYLGQSRRHFGDGFKSEIRDEIEVTAQNCNTRRVCTRSWILKSNIERSLAAILLDVIIVEAYLDIFNRINRYADYEASSLEFPDFNRRISREYYILHITSSRFLVSRNVKSREITEINICFSNIIFVYLRTKYRRLIKKF